MSDPLNPSVLSVALTKMIERDPGLLEELQAKEIDPDSVDMRILASISQVPSDEEVLYACLSIYDQDQPAIASEVIACDKCGIAMWISTLVNRALQIREGKVTRACLACATKEMNHDAA